MKKIDKLLLGSFIPPFVVTFFIALFVLIMQTLWVYIDDIIGKGAGLGMIMEFLFYLSISVFPMALPVAVLISSVMVMGNLAENYELSSMKSAGISLLRVMKPLMFACVGIAVFSWLSANYLIPVANLKFKSRLYDMRKQKPTLNMEEGVFNDDFDGYRIRIGEKGKDKKTIKDILIANHISSQKDKLNELVAKEGIMFTTKDERFLVMELEDGEQFQEGDRYLAAKTKAPFVRTSFKKYTKIFDMQEFDINRTDEELFRTHYSMLSMKQLEAAIDSIDRQIVNRQNKLGEYVNNYFSVLKKDALKTVPTENAPIKRAINKIDAEAINDSATVVATSAPNSYTYSNETALKNQKINPIKKVSNKFIKKQKTPTKKQIAALQKKKRKKKYDQTLHPTPQTLDNELSEYSSLLETFPNHKTQPLSNKALQFSRSIKSNAASAKRFIIKTKEKRVKHVFELNSKYAFATICFVFLFIGAPMGALVRKGGFGYPLLIAIFFFVLFITLTLTFKRMAEASVLSAMVSVWMPNLIILPMGLFLTYKAMNDSKVFDTTRAKIFFQKVRERFLRGGSLQ